ncbi:MAG: membrane protein insertase YidC [Mariprofundales bacterium]
MELKNMFLAFMLSMMVLLGWSWIFPPPEQTSEVAETSKQVEESITIPANHSADIPTISSPNSIELEDIKVDNSNIGIANKALSTSEAGVQQASYELANDLLKLTIDSRGRIIHGIIPQYKESMDADAKAVAIISLHEDDHSVYISSGVQGQSQPLQFRQLADSTPSVLHLQATLDDGRLLTRTMNLAADSYLLELSDVISGNDGATLYYQTIERFPNRKASTFYEHVGAVGILNDQLQEPDYDELDEKSQRISATGGWNGIMNRYFLTAIIGDTEREQNYFFKGNGRIYQSGLLLDSKADANGAQRVDLRIFVGPKSIPIMQQYGAELERSVDFGYFAFIAKPMHDLLLWLYHNVVANYGGCIILLVLTIKILFYWPTMKSYESMAGMRKLQPDMERMRERLGDDKKKLGQEMMDLYKKKKVNPLGGCLPILIQIPVFFALYKVLLMSIEMRHAPFMGWIQDLSYQDPFYVLPILMGASMYIQHQLNPQPPDPVQAKVMQFLPLIFTVMFLFFPSGLVLYWLVNNVLSIIQQRYVMKQHNAL